MSAQLQRKQNQSLLRRLLGFWLPVRPKSLPTLPSNAQNRSSALSSDLLESHLLDLKNKALALELERRIASDR